MLRYTLLFTGEDGTSQFEDVEVPLSPEEPAPHELRVSRPIPASAVLLGVLLPTAVIPSNPSRGDNS